MKPTTTLKPGQPTWQTLQLEERLAKMQKGETVPVSALAELVNATPNEPAFNGWLNTARKKLERSQDFVFHRAAWQLTRLTDSQAVAHLDGELRRQHKQSKRTLKRTANVDTSKLSADDRTRLITVQTIESVIVHCSEEKKVAALESSLSDAQAQLTLNATLGYFLNP